MSARRHALGLAAATLASAALVGFAATPASAAADTAAAPITKTQVVLETSLRSNAEAHIEAFTCPQDSHPYLIDRVDPLSGRAPKGVIVRQDAGLVTTFVSAPALNADGLVTGWTADTRKATVFHPDWGGTAAPKSITITATCTSDPAAAYSPA
jgi:hypothetical protein